MLHLALLERVKKPVSWEFIKDIVDRLALKTFGERKKRYQVPFWPLQIEIGGKFVHIYESGNVLGDFAAFRSYLRNLDAQSLSTHDKIILFLIHSAWIKQEAFQTEHFANPPKPPEVRAAEEEFARIMEDMPPNVQAEVRLANQDLESRLPKIRPRKTVEIPTASGEVIKVEYEHFS